MRNKLGGDKMEIIEEIKKLKEAIAVLSSDAVELRGKIKRLEERIERIEEERSGIGEKNLIEWLNDKEDDEEEYDERWLEKMVYRTGEDKLVSLQKTLIAK